MIGTGPLVLAVLVLSAGTFLLRVAGPVIDAAGVLTASRQALLQRAALALLCALAVTSTLLEDGGFAGLARPLGFLAGGAVAWRRGPLVVVVLVAALTTALLRALGVA